MSGLFGVYICAKIGVISQFYVVILVLFLGTSNVASWIRCAGERI